jgi:hypothetical protein
MANDMSRGFWSRAVDALHGLIHPGFREERRRLEQIASRLDKADATRREQAAELRELMTRVWKKVESQATHRDLRGLDHRLGQVEGAIGRQYHIVGRALKLAEWQEEQRVNERRLRKRLARLASGDGPVIVGPWTGEVGFELLYWIPFVSRALQQASVSPERIVIVSRGGTRPWYAHLGGRYVDVLSLVTPDRFRAETVVEKKQKAMGSFDRELVRSVLRDIGTRRGSLLHPGLMYPLFQPFWKQRENVGRVEQYTAHRLFDAAAAPERPSRLPAEYVAVRFYFSACFPDTPANRAFADAIVEHLAASGHVVLLNTRINVDDHVDYAAAPNPRIHYVDDLMTPHDNLALQTSVIAGARAFVGTYGGFSYLAPLYRVPSLAFYSEYDAFFQHHLDFAQRVFRRLSAGSLVPIDVRDAGLLRRALARDAAVSP